MKDQETHDYVCWQQGAPEDTVAIRGVMGPETAARAYVTKSIPGVALGHLDTITGHRNILMVMVCHASMPKASLYSIEVSISVRPGT